MRKTLLIMLLCFTSLSVAGASASPVEQLVLVLWHGLELEQALAFEFAEPQAWGMLNTRAGGGQSLSGSYLSLGAGARAVGHPSAATFLQGEGAQELYGLHTGLPPGLLVQPDIALIKSAQNVNYTVELGALGSAFLEAGVPPRVLGNSDGAEMTRWAALVGMDGTGRIWEGNVSSALTLSDPSYPYGMRTDYAVLTREVLRAQEPLVVVDLGDPFRYDQYQKSLLPTQKANIKARMVAEAYEFLQEVAENKPPQSMLLIVSPYPPQHRAEQGHWLTPIICLGLDDGLLISGTTRWPGLITNMDVAPTILDLLGIEHQQPFIGRPASIQASDQARLWVEEFEKKIMELALYRSLVLRVFVLSQIVLYSSALISLIISNRLPSWLGRTLQLSLVLFLTIPLALLLWGGPRWTLLALILGVALLCLRYQKPLPKVGVIALCTVTIISYDVLRGSWLMRYSFLGYDPIGGARFYGLGNELMGILVGAAVMGWAVLAEGIGFSARWRNILGFLLFGALVIIIGAPSLGTNVGGAICAVFAFGSTWLALRGKGVSWRTALTLIVVVGLVLGGLMLMDQTNPSTEQSHIGQTVALFRRDGFRALQLIIVRKLAMNFKLLRYSIWSKALIVAIATMGASFIWPSKFIFWLRKTHPLIAKGIGGVVIGSVAAFIFNDSGVVAAATCLYFGSTTLLLLALELKHDFDAP